jgi:RNA binding exosome subunit
MKSAIQSLDVSLLLHETEDSERVVAVVRGLIGVDGPVETEEMEGHFGNSIKKVGVHLNGDQATKAFSFLTAKIPVGRRKELARDIDKLVDEHSSLFLRFDKQKLVKGEIAMGYEDAIRLKVKPRAFLMHGRAREFFLEQLRAR